MSRFDAAEVHEAGRQMRRTTADDDPRGAKAPRSGGFRWGTLAAAAAVALGVALFVARFQEESVIQTKFAPGIAERTPLAVPATPDLASLPRSQPTIDPQATGYTLGAAEAALLRLLLQKDFLAFGRGESSAADDPGVGATFWDGEKPKRVTAEELQSDYDADEIGADRRYEGKTLLVSGTADSAGGSAAEPYAISLRGGRRPNLRPKARMTVSFGDFVGSVGKGQPVALACRGGGAVGGGAILDACRPLEDWVTEEAERYLGTAGRKIAAGERNVALLVMTAMTVASALPESSECFKVSSPSRGCDAEIQAVMASMPDPSAFKPAADRLHVDLATVLLEGRPGVGETPAAAAPAEPAPAAQIDSPKTDADYRAKCASIKPGETMAWCAQYGMPTTGGPPNTP